MRHAVMGVTRVSHRALRLGTRSRKGTMDWSSFVAAFVASFLRPPRLVEIPPARNAHGARDAASRPESNTPYTSEIEKSHA